MLTHFKKPGIEKLSLNVLGLTEQRGGRRHEAPARASVGSGAGETLLEREAGRAEVPDAGATPLALLARMATDPACSSADGRSDVDADDAMGDGFCLRRLEAGVIYFNVLPQRLWCPRLKIFGILKIGGGAARGSTEKPFTS
jgi:hypothetical protein